VKVVKSKKKITKKVVNLPKRTTSKTTLITAIATSTVNPLNSTLSQVVVKIAHAITLPQLMLHPTQDPKEAMLHLQVTSIPQATMALLLVEAN